MLKVGSLPSQLVPYIHLVPSQFIRPIDVAAHLQVQACPCSCPWTLDKGITIIILRHHHDHVKISGAVSIKEQSADCQVESCHTGNFSSITLLLFTFIFAKQKSVHHRKANSLHRHCPKRRAPRPYQHQTQHHCHLGIFEGVSYFSLSLSSLVSPLSGKTNGAEKEGQMWRMSSGRRRSPLVPAPSGSQRHKIPSQQETDFKSIF